MSVNSLPACRWGHLRSLPRLGMLALALAVSGNSFGQERNDDLQTIDVAGTDQQLRAPKGVQVEKVASLDSPRMISIGLDGEMFIGSRSGSIYRSVPPYDQATSLAEIGDLPNSVIQRGNHLYVATTTALMRADYQAGASLAADDFEEVAKLPGGDGHNTRTLTTGPDGRIYLSLGIQGNCSDQFIGEGYDFADRRGGIMVLDESGDSPQWRPYATGLRNPVGLAWNHEGVLFATNNGPDHWGYELPREVVVRTEEGSFHGMPWFQWVAGEYRRDDCVGSEPPQSADVIPPPVATLPARSAPLGLAFLPKGNGLALDAIVAVHGSSATQPDGRVSGDPATRRKPRIVGITFDEQGQGQVSELLSGFQNEQGRRWARPAGIAFAPDGALYFTSDRGEGGLYRVTFDGEPVGADTTLDESVQSDE
ncbi:PQQ-dependent sugar dehydrogenase [Litchfieldella rifensis]|uniref:PQQ-dependent sugar dehydrogenase n=1 Tax=Litchfieldella rifensis TaxID=762643 RepID=A0ABV7LIB9_9GAMM